MSLSEEKINKLMDIIKHDIIGFTFIFKNNEDKIPVNIKYNSEKDSYTIKIYQKNDEKVTNNLKVEDIIYFLTRNEYIEAINKLVESRIKKDKTYESTKQSLLNQLNSMDISDTNKERIQVIIGKVCQNSKRVGTENKFYLNEFEYVELSGKTDFSTEEDFLHLQLVRIVDGPNGEYFNTYPKFTFEELIEYICKTILVNTEEQSSKKYKTKVKTLNLSSK